MDETPTTIANEFATVRVQVDRSANGPRLRIEDAGTGIAIYLDALELQSLAWATHKDLSTFAAPEFRERAFDRVLGRALSTVAISEAEAILRRIESNE